MVDRIPYNAARPSAGSLFAQWLTKRLVHGDSFGCGVRVITGAVPGEGRRWRFRRSSVDPLIDRGVVTLRHGTATILHLVVDTEALAPTPAPAGRPGFVVLDATERPSGARVQVCVHADELERFGVLTG